MDETSTRSWVRGILPGVHDWIIDLITEEFEREYARNKEYKDKALSFDLDQAGIRQREKEAVELVELRARLAEMEKNYQQLMHYFAIRDMQQKIKAVEENKNAAPIKWHKDGNDYVYEEGEDILMTITPLYANGYPDGYDRLGTYRCSVWADPTKRDDPVFRVTVESIEMGKHCLQTWLDQHGANWRSQPKIEVKRGKEKTKV